MKYVFLALLFLAIQSCELSTRSPSAETMTNTDIWWTYLADYDGRPGSTIVNLALKRVAPLKSHQTLLVTGVNYASQPNGSGLPNESELDFLHRLSTKRLELIARTSNAIFVGSFTHNGERLDYFYLSDAEGLETVLKAFYKSECSDRIPHINIKNDSEWDAFLNFLYPNPATIEQNRTELVKLGVI